MYIRNFYPDPFPSSCSSISTTARPTSTSNRPFKRCTSRSSKSSFTCDPFCGGDRYPPRPRPPRLLTLLPAPANPSDTSSCSSIHNRPVDVAHDTQPSCDRGGLMFGSAGTALPNGDGKRFRAEVGRDDSLSTGGGGGVTALYLRRGGVRGWTSIGNPRSSCGIPRCSRGKPRWSCEEEVLKCGASGKTERVDGLSCFIRSHASRLGESKNTCNVYGSCAYGGAVGVERSSPKCKATF